MRFSYVFIGLLVLGTASAQLAAIAGAVKGAAALGTTVAKLTAGLLPIKAFALPVAAIGPLKLSVPALLGLKALKLAKLKLLLVKAPFLAPAAIAGAKFGLLKAKYGVAKAALTATGKTTNGLLDLPLKLTAVKIGAVAGAASGAKAGLLRYNTSPKSSIFEQFSVPAASLVNGAGSLVPRIPMKTITVSVKSGEPPTPQVHQPTY